MMRCAAFLALSTSAVLAVADESDAPVLPTHTRRPVALVTLGDRLLVGNQRSGSISVLDLETRRVMAEHSVPARIVDLAAHPGGADLLVLDGSGHRLLSATLRDGALAVEPLAEVAADPVRFVVAAEQARVYVTSRWSWRVTVVQFDEAFARVQDSRQINLPFPPRELLLIDNDRHLLVSDAFAARLAVLDTETLEVRRTCELPGHNIRGLAVARSGKHVLVSQQKLNPLASTEFDDIHWGQLINNALRVVSFKNLLDPESDPTEDGWLEQLGRVGDAAADPGTVLVDDRGRQIVALAGVDEIAVSQASYSERIQVGRLPVALALAPDQQLAVANHLDDSVSLIDLEAGRRIHTVPLGPAPEPTSADRGESLFFDGRVSHDGWMSCQSCHTDGHTAEHLVDTLGDDGYGAPKRIPSLLGTAGTAPWGWAGNKETLEAQVLQSVRHTMHGPVPSDEQLADLVAYLESLEPPPARAVADTKLVQRGEALFRRHGCVRCHEPSALTSSGTYDVGLVDESGRKEFNPPSLRGVGQRRRLFHDGRADGLSDVVGKLKHQLAAPLSADDAAALLAYLNSL